MRIKALRRVVGAAALAAAALAPTSAQAGIWTPIASGTTEQINAIDYQSPTRLWYATTNGTIGYRKPDGTFGKGAGPGVGVIFNDIAFQPGGTVGIAVGSANNVWRSTNGGANWTKLTIAAPLNNDDCYGDPDAGTSPFDIAFSVHWAGANTVYITGNKNNILKSANAGASFAEVNKKANDNDGTACRMTSSYYSWTDSAWVSDTTGYFVSRYFGSMRFTDSGLTSDAVQRGDSVNEFDGRPRMAIDPANPSRIWVVDKDSYDYSQDGGSTFPYGAMRFPNQTEYPQSLQDIAFSGGTVLMTGSAGQIFNSIDGRDFYAQKVDGMLTNDWKAVSLASATQAAVGGTGGALVVTDAATTIPPPPVTSPTPTPIVRTPTTTTPPPPATSTPTPIQGQTSVAERSRGTVLIQRSGRLVSLSDVLSALALGTLVDATRGTIVINLAGGSSATLSDGQFKVTQSAGTNTITMQTPAGKATVCSSKAPPKGVVRTLKGTLKGAFSIVAGAGTVSAANGSFVIQDTCKGTRIKNVKGIVSVKKKGAKKAKVIRPGKTYVLKAKLFKARTRR